MDGRTEAAADRVAFYRAAASDGRNDRVFAAESEVEPEVAERCWEQVQKWAREDEAAAGGAAEG